MGGSWDVRVTVDKLIGYFERQDQAVPELVDGTCTARELSLLLRAATVDPVALRHVVALIDRGQGYGGSGWVELRLAFEHWNSGDVHM